MTETVRCAAEGCRREATTAGLCAKHYQRVRQHGDPNAPSQRTKLSTADVTAIRRARPKWGINMVLAKQYGVTASTISAIRRGERRNKGSRP